jgi:valyl-tRNA synthetase
LCYGRCINYLSINRWLVFMDADPSFSEADFPKAYEAGAVETQWYHFWEEGKFFQASPSSAKPPYVISIPPPNVTGSLHMGHAIGNTLQDVLIRWKRMSGYEALWVPGTDHAGIATQTVVERHLIKTHGKTRKEFPREEFLEHIWEWKERSQEQILGQVKRLGCSCDWSRLRFTMDEGCNLAVRKAFKKLYEAGKIYRGLYLVNWDPVTQTALADDEVEYEEHASSLWYLKYPLADGSGYVHLATTRPETMLGDTAIAISPRDSRYAHLVGKHVLLPLVNREIPIIADHYVDPEFGTGVVKITPAHDPNDYQIGQRHGLPMITIMTPDGHINEQGAQFAGLTMAAARTAVVEALQKLNLVEKIEPHVHRVGISYRSKAKIEPFLSEQWFVRMDEFGQKLRRCVDEGRVKLVPQHWESTYFHWIDNLRDWCISRQLWWGHRIPVWYHRTDAKRMICYDGVGTPPEVAAAPDEWYQDEDVLDTWFSSALWPLSILGWPEETPELVRFYPNAVLVTGHDILFFWVARMLMMGEYLRDDPPFSDVFLHGLIYGKSYWRKRPDGAVQYVSADERKAYDLGQSVPADVFFKWEKMSKTKGNVIDPIEIIDDYGADAMRMALCASASQAREIDLDRRRFEDFKNFANKVWNGARFTMLNLEANSNNGSALTAEEFSKGLDESQLDLEGRWILSKLGATVRAVNEQLAAYAFDQAASLAYDFFWREFCAYYLEIIKPVLSGRKGSVVQRTNKQKILVIVLCQIVRLLHPMAPFITEELFQRLKKRIGPVQAAADADPYTQEAIAALNAPACIVAPYPTIIRSEDIRVDINSAFDLLRESVHVIRNLRGEMQLPPAVPVDIYMAGDPSSSAYRQLERHICIIEALVRVGKIEFTDKPQREFGVTGTVQGVTLFIPLPPQYRAQEKQRLIKEQQRLEVACLGVRQRLDNSAFVERAPQHLVAEQRAQLAQFEQQLQIARSSLERLED